MVDRSHKPTAISPTASGPQPSVLAEGDKVTATLPTGESVEILLYGATVTSWKTLGKENLWLSDKAVLDGTKAVRGGIPVVFPVFGPPPKNHATSTLPQHGFARVSKWEYLGRATTEAAAATPSALDEGRATSSVRLDFGLTPTNLTAEMRDAWPYKFSLQYSVTLSGNDELRTSLSVRNEGDDKFEFQALLHTYLRVPDVTSINITGLAGSTYADKTQNMSTHASQDSALQISGETDRVYKSLSLSTTSVSSNNDGKLFDVVRDASFADLVIWNPWKEIANGLTDFEPKNAYMNMLCLEAGAVDGWVALEGQDAFEAGQVLKRY